MVLVSFRQVIRCDIGVSATGCLLQPYIQKNMTVFVSLCTFSELCNYPCHLYHTATAAEPTQMYNSNLELGKKRNILAHKILLGGVSACFLCSKTILQKNCGLPQGFNSPSVPSVEGMGGWPGECRTNNMLVYAAWMQMIDWGHKLGEFVRQKASCMQPGFVDEMGGFTQRFIITP